MKTYGFSRFNSLLVSVLLALAVLSLSACSSPEEKAESFYASGMEYLDQGELSKANIEFRNALQINADMTRALWGMALVAERQAEWQRMFSLLNKILNIDPNHLQAQVKSGGLLLAGGQLDKALEMSNRSYELDKNDVSVLALRGAVFLKLDNPEDAKKYAHAALAKEPDNIDALVILAAERLEAGDAVGAIEYMDKGLAVDNKHVALQLFKIKALTKLSEVGKAEDIYKKLIQFYPDNAAFRYALAEFYYKQKQYAAAEKELRKTVESYPSDLDAKLKLVRYLSLTKGVEAGRGQLEQFVASDPDNYEIKFMLGDFYTSSRAYEEAKQLYNGIIDSQGKNENGVKARSQLASVHFTTGDKPAALEQVKKVLAIDAKNEQALLLKASMDLDNQQYDNAIASMRTILRDVPDSGRALLLLAKAYELSGSPELSEKQYFKAFQASNNNVTYGLEYARFLVKRGRYRRADTILEGLLARAPANPDVLKLLARTKITLADWSGAQRVADEIMRQGDKDDVAYQITGAIQAGQKKYSESISTFEKAYKSSPDKVRPIVSLVRAYLLAGREKEATDFLDAVITANPADAASHLLRGQLYAREGNIDAASELYKKVITLSADKPEGYYHLAILYSQNEKYDAALATLQQGLDKMPGDFLLTLVQASVHELTGEFEKAIALYESLLLKRPQSDIVANNLASLLSEHRTDDKSLNRSYALSQRFRQSDIPQFKDTLGWSSHKVGKYSDASVLLENVVDELPGMPIFHYHLGMNYLAKEDKEAAKAELEKALQLAGDRSFAQVEEIRKVLKDL